MKNFKKFIEELQNLPNDFSKSTGCQGDKAETVSESDFCLQAETQKLASLPARAFLADIPAACGKTLP